MGAFLLPGLLILSVVFSLDAVDAKAPDTVAVDVHYESLCPDSRRFFLKHLWPTFQELETRLKLRLIPYGNARVSGKPNHWSFICQHGPDECFGNIAQSCAIKIMNDTRSSLEFAVCAFNYRKQSVIIDKCIESTEMKDKIKYCTDGPMGGNFEHEMAVLTESLKPPQTFIPWITVNGKGSEYINNRANENFMNLLCEMYQNVPEACEKHRRSMRDLYRRLVGL